MTLLIIYVAIALGVSFICSVAEAVLLSVSAPYIALKQQEGQRSGAVLARLKDDINSPLAAILTLNTIAHTIGAAGAGAQAAVVFGSDAVGIASAVLTLLILVFSEIIPKTLGAVYWRQLAPLTGHVLIMLMWMLWPFIKLSALLTSSLSHGPTLRGFSREEFRAMAELGAEEGELEEQESRILRNLLHLRDLNVKAAMTPRTVVVRAQETQTVDAFFSAHAGDRFSRIPVYADNPDHYSGFVLRADLILAQARGNTDKPLTEYRRELLRLPASLSLLRAYQKLIDQRAHIAVILDEYGATLGLLTLEDVLETLLGLEIVDEGDRTEDMQALARTLWRRRAKEMGLAADSSEG